MSDEHLYTDTPSTPSSEVVDTPNTGGEDLGAGEPIAPEPDDVSGDYAGWDGELESLDNQQWFTQLEGGAREALRGGYRATRTNVTKALHAKATELAQLRREVERQEQHHSTRATQYAAAIEKLQSLMEDEDADSSERVTALKAGYEERVAGFKAEVAKYQSDNSELFSDNRELLSAFERAKGETAGIRSHYENQLASFRQRAESAYHQMRQERDHYAHRASESNERELEQEFGATFPYMGHDDSRRAEAQAAYFDTLRAHVTRNNGKLYPDEQWERIEQITAAQVRALYPELNEKPPSMPAAEGLAQTPRSAGTSTYQSFRSNNKGTMF